MFLLKAVDIQIRTLSQSNQTTRGQNRPVPKGDNPSMYVPIGSGDQDAAYYERERPSGSYSKSISHLILRAFSDRAHSIDLQRKGSQIVPLSKSRHATSNFKTGQ